MNTSELVHLMDSWLGGSDGRTRHWANRRFIFTEGVKDVADQAGAHWLLDIVATEVAPICLRAWDQTQEYAHFLTFDVANNAGKLALVQDEGLPSIWEKRVSYTDFPDGAWMFYLMIDGVIEPDANVLVMLLPQEN